jgi:hypothetical protein
MLSIGKLASMAEGPAATSQDKVQGKLMLELNLGDTQVLFSFQQFARLHGYSQYSLGAIQRGVGKPCQFCSRISSPSHHIGEMRYSIRPTSLAGCGFSSIIDYDFT